MSQQGSLKHYTNQNTVAWAQEYTNTEMEQNRIWKQTTCVQEYNDKTGAKNQRGNDKLRMIINDAGKIA